MTYDDWKTTDPTNLDRDEGLEEPVYAPPEQREPAPPAPPAPVRLPLALEIA